MAKKSPLAPAGFPDIPAVPGVRIASASCGLRYKGRKDVFLAALVKGTQVAGVFAIEDGGGAGTGAGSRRAGVGQG